MAKEVSAEFEVIEELDLAIDLETGEIFHLDVVRDTTDLAE